MPKNLRPILELSLRVVGQAVRLAAVGAKRGVSALVKVIGDRRRGSLRTDTDQAPPEAYVPAPEPVTSPTSRPEPPAVSADASAAPPAASADSPEAPASPAHVSEEPTLVTASADAGAEEGAGPELHVAEPWEGYAQMTASDVAARLNEATAEEVAVVQLYETAHRGRKTVLAAAERRLKRVGPDPGG